MMPIDARPGRRLRRLRALALVLIIMQQAPRAYLRDNPIILHVPRRGCVRVNDVFASFLCQSILCQLFLAIVAKFRTGLLEAG